MSTGRTVAEPDGIDLDAVAAAVRGYVGIERKRPIQEAFDLLRATHGYGPQLPNHGDDAAVIPWNDGFLLLAADGMMRRLLVNEPYAAGKAAVMVTVNDIFAMGGRPLGMVNVMASGDPEQRSAIIRGIEKGCHKLRVPMLGGHLHPDAPADLPDLSVAILGWATALLRSHQARAGDRIVLAVDLDGRAGCRSVTSWDANSGKSPEVLRHRLEALPLIAERGYAAAAKDVSNAGILGTTAILAENSGTGARIDIEAIPVPPGIALLDWLTCFQSFGFVLSAASENVPPILSLFAERGITAAVIGEITDDPIVAVAGSAGTRTLFDFRKDAITGIRLGTTPPPAP